MTTRRVPILLVGDTLSLGGTEGQFVEVACGIDRSRWDLRVCCLRAEGPLRPKLEAAGLSTWSCGRGSFKSPRFLAALWIFVRYLRAHQIQLVHSFDFYSNVFAVVAARLARVPVVIASQRDLGDARPARQRWVQSMVLQLADHVLVNAEAVAERLKRHRVVAAGRITVIVNGVDLERFTPRPGRTLASRPVHVGTLANLRPEKGIAHLIGAAALVLERSPKARFLIWGDGPVRPHLERLIQELGLEGSVELRGKTAAPEVALRELDIFVLPAVSNEGSPNVLLEAMATQLAVVATDVGGSAALVEDQVTGLIVPPGDQAALSKAIIRLMEEPSFAVNLTARARERVQTEFGREQMLARMQAFYEQALARGRG